MPVAIERLTYKGWPNCYRISNGAVEAVITGDVGPRVIRFGFCSGQNFFKEFPDQLGKSGEETWKPRGGHRLWAAPEDRVRTYAPDNGTVAISIYDGVVRATGPVEPLTGLEKQIALRMASEGTAVELSHRIRNVGSEPATFAPWALTMMAPGGVAIHGFPPRGSHAGNLSPSHPVVMWAYTKLNDPRWILLEKYVCLRHDPAAATAQKLGSFHPNTWGAYLLGEDLFIKRFDAAGGPPDYPDYGCSFELFANGDFLELETLGPSATLRPGESVLHTEHWSLHQGVRVDVWCDPELDRVIVPLLTGTE